MRLVLLIKFFLVYTRLRVKDKIVWQLNGIINFRDVRENVLVCSSMLFLLILLTPCYSQDHAAIVQAGFYS